MWPVRELIVALAVAAGVAAAAEPERSNALAVPGLRRDEPITVTSHALEFDYKQNVVVYRGDVRAVQGDVRLQSDELTIRLRDAKGEDGAAAPASAGTPSGAPVLEGRVQLREIVASGHVRIDQGDRWATGARAVFDETARTLVLSGGPVLHDGPSQIAGERVVVYLDENRSVVEGGQGRVKAVLYPDRSGAGAASK